MNRPCEGSAKSGAAFFYAQILFHFCAHKPYAPEHPAEPPPRPVCTRSPLCVGCPYPAILSEYNAIPENYRGIWIVERWDLPDWAEIREKHIGKRTMMVNDLSLIHIFSA